MAAVLEYKYQYGTPTLRKFKPEDTKPFSALFKCYVKEPDKEELQIIEKPSTRPATFQECYLMARKLKNEYGKNLKLLLVWDMDAINEVNPY